MDYTIYCDKFPKDGETIFGISRFIQPGGKGANQAAAVGKSGLTNCYFLACRGIDNDGEQIEKTLTDIGVHCLMKKVPVETGNATIFVNRESENQIVVVSGANNELIPDDLKDVEFKDYSCIVLQNEIPEKTNEYIIKKAHSLNIPIIYNPAPYRPMSEELYEKINYFIVNEVELQSYAKEPNIDKGINILLSKGIQNLIVTLGSKGSLFASLDQTISVPCYKSKVVDTVGAGDTYVGYFASGLCSGLDVASAMDLASRASSITVSRKGSIISIPKGEEIK